MIEPKLGTPVEVNCFPIVMTSLDLSLRLLIWFLAFEVSHRGYLCHRDHYQINSPRISPVINLSKTTKLIPIEFQPSNLCREERSMDQYRSRLKLSENFERHWSIRISGEIHMDQSLVHTFSCGNSYGPMVLKVLQKFPPTLVLVHGWLFPALALSSQAPVRKRKWSGKTSPEVFLRNCPAPNCRI